MKSSLDVAGAMSVVMLIAGLGFANFVQYERNMQLESELAIHTAPVKGLTASALFTVCTKNTGMLHMVRVTTNLWTVQCVDGAKFEHIKIDFKEPQETQG